MTLFPANRAGGGGQGERVRAAAIAGGQKGCDKSAAAGPQVLPPAFPLPPKSTQDSLAGSGDAEDVITSASPTVSRSASSAPVPPPAERTIF